MKTSGHVLIYMPEHPFANRSYVPEHRIILEKKLGRYLNAEEIVHHINMKNNDNRPENLMIVHSQTEHNNLHWNFVKTIQQLMEFQIIIFDRDTRAYKINLAKFGELDNGISKM